MPHAAVLLAGGKSTRMGRDKSALPVNGEPLWEHQISILRATDPAELFISGQSDGPYANAGVEILADEFPNCGPLGGLATVLRRCTSERLLVLAVDMPAMTAAFLLTLIEESERHATGIVPSVAALVRPRARIPFHAMSSAGHRLEPLAAVYPAASLAVAEECLRVGERKLEAFIRTLEAQRIVTIRTVGAEEVSLFMNWNAPMDILAPPSERRPVCPLQSPDLEPDAGVQ